MSTDPRRQGPDNAAERGTSGPASRPMGIRQALREIRKGIVVMWWGFFDWVAVVSWKALLLVSFLGLILGGGILKHPDAGLFPHRRLVHHQGGGGRQAQSGT